MSSVTKAIEELFCVANETAGVLLHCVKNTTIRSQQEMNDVNAQVDRIKVKQGILLCEIQALKRIVDGDIFEDTESNLNKNGGNKRQEKKTKN